MSLGSIKYTRFSLALISLSSLMLPSVARPDAEVFLSDEMARIAEPTSTRTDSTLKPVGDSACGLSFLKARTSAYEGKHPSVKINFSTRMRLGPYDDRWEVLYGYLHRDPYRPTGTLRAHVLVSRDALKGWGQVGKNTACVFEGVVEAATEDRGILVRASRMRCFGDGWDVWRKVSALASREGAYEDGVELRRRMLEELRVLSQ